MADKDDKGKPGSDKPAAETDRHATATPPAGPHAKPDLVNPDATPGSGAITAETPTGEADAGSG